MKAAILLALAAALPLSAATISISPATPKAGDSVVVTVHDRGGACPSTATTAKLVGQTLQVDVAVTPGGCLQGCPTIDVPVAYWNPATKEYERIEVAEQVEVLSLAGNLGADGAETKIHAHATLGRRDGSAIGGHVLAATVFPTLEMHVVDYGATVVRGTDEETGLSLIKRVE